MSFRAVAKSAEQVIRRGVITGISTLSRRSTTLPQPSDLGNFRVLLIRQDRIGDVLVSTPLITVLKKRFPDITLDMLVSTNNAMVVPGISGIDRTWVYRKSLFPIVSLLRRIRNEQYDLAIDLMDNPSATSTVLCQLSGARWTLGIEKENASVYDIRVPLLSRRDVHIVRRIAELLRPFGIDPDGEQLQISFDPGRTATSKARQLLADLGLIGTDPLCINISAGSRSRAWKIAHYRVLVKHLESAYSDRPIVIACAPRDKQTAAEIVRSSHAAVLLPVTNDFLQFAACLRFMSCIITPDTAIVHIAAAYRVPCVVMFIQTDPSLKIWAPFNAPHRSLVSSFDSLDPISPDAVFSAVKDLLSLHRPSGRRRPVKKR